MSQNASMLTTKGSTTPEVLFELYRRMTLIRKFEERVAKLFARGKLPGFVHLYIGQEAVAVGVCSVLHTEDYITSTHRGHGHTIAKGGDVKRMMAELYGKVTGYCKGKGGSMHITDMSVGMLGANGIVSGGLPIAMGAAYGAGKIRQTDQVVVAFFGDGATNEGPFHESANMASAWKLPMIFACENNLYGVGTRLGRISPTEDLVVRGSGYQMPTMSVDGMDVLAVREATEAAVANARAGKGPTFIEFKTWRYKGHFEGENPMYWDKDEFDSWVKRDAIQRLGRIMIDQGVATQSKLDEVAQDVEHELDEAVRFAEESPLPAPEDALNDIFA